MSHPDGLPDLFFDRSLGRLVVPNLLRAAGLRLTTLAERYGMPADENVPDVTWLADAGSRSEAALMKDERIARNVAERNAVEAHGVRCFCLARADLTGRAMAELYLAHLERMVDACADGSAGIWVLSGRGMRRLLR